MSGPKRRGLFVLSSEIHSAGIDACVAKPPFEEVRMGWMPRSGLDSAEGLVWLPRLLDKARRCAASPAGRLVDGYCYGDSDIIDKELIAFLRTDDVAISAVVREHADDGEAARVIVERSGRSRTECEAFSKRFRRKFMDFVLIEADEDRLPRGPKATIVKFLYNAVMMPVVYRLFRRDERKRVAEPVR
jgi:uncharacterized protein DUF5069